MSIHIVFTDGSNPYIKYNMTPAEFAEEILKWCKGFDLDYIGATEGSIINFTATDKRARAITGAAANDLPPW